MPSKKRNPATRKPRSFTLTGFGDKRLADYAYLENAVSRCVRRAILLPGNSPKGYRVINIRTGLVLYSITEHNGNILVKKERN